MSPGADPVWHFVRHAESVANRDGWLAGHADAPLSEAGEAAARDAASRLAGLDIQRAFTSDLRRAWHTAELLLADHPVDARQVRALRERDLGSWERTSADRLSDGAPELYRWDQGPPGGESPRQVAHRFLAFFAVCPDIHGGTLVVAHGLALKALLGLIDGLPTDGMLAERYPNLTLQTRRVSRARFEQLLTELTDGESA